MPYFVYILRTNEGTLYTGQTNNLGKRIAEHKGKRVGAAYLRMFASFEVVYKEEFGTRSEAMKREAAVKRMTKKQKEALVASL